MPALTIQRALLVALVGSTALAGGCARHRVLAESSEVAPERSQVEQRAYQTRAFDTTDEEQTVRIVVAALQDLDFVIDQVSPALGVVSGTRMGQRNAMRITVTVRPRGSSSKARGFPRASLTI